MDNLFSICENKNILSTSNAENDLLCLFCCHRLVDVYKNRISNANKNIDKAELDIQTSSNTFGNAF